jgi:hypothetical protein
MIIELTIQLWCLRDQTTKSKSEIGGITKAQGRLPRSYITYIKRQFVNWSLIYCRDHFKVQSPSFSVHTEFALTHSRQTLNSWTRSRPIDSFAGTSSKPGPPRLFQKSIVFERFVWFEDGSYLYCIVVKSSLAVSTVRPRVV